MVKKHSSNNSKPPLSFNHMIKCSLGSVLESELVIGSIHMIKISLGVVQVTPENGSLAYMEFNLIVCVSPHSSLVYKHTHFTRWLKHTVLLHLVPVIMHQLSQPCIQGTM